MNTVATKLFILFTSRNLSNFVKFKCVTLNTCYPWELINLWNVRNVVYMIEGYMIQGFYNNVVYTTKKLIVYTLVHDRYKSTIFSYHIRSICTNLGQSRWNRTCYLDMMTFKFEICLTPIVYINYNSPRNTPCHQRMHSFLLSNIMHNW